MMLFPLRFHYFLWKGLAVFLQKVIGYRRTTVQENLKNSFPEKSTQELKQIENSFYHRFTSTILSSIYILNLSSKKHEKRCIFENHDLFLEHYNQNKNIILVGGHLGNWEFFKPTNKMTERMYYAYKELNNKISDQFIKEVRKKTKMEPLEVTQTYRTLISDFKSHKNFVYFFYADQRPIIGKESDFWIEFLHQPTNFIITAEKIASKTKAAVMFFKMYEEKPGYFKVRFELLSPDASQEEEWFVTKRYVQELEKAIIERPDHWLWTHRRWKHKPTEEQLKNMKQKL